MCLAALALDCSRRFPFVVAANRDEFFHRPAARLGWWQPEGGGGVGKVDPARAQVGGL